MMTTEKNIWNLKPGDKVLLNEEAPSSAHVWVEVDSIFPSRTGLSAVVRFKNGVRWSCDQLTKFIVRSSLRDL